MAKWADYLITAVQYDESHSKINKCMTLVDLGDSVGPEQVQTRQTIIASITHGTTYVTVFKTSTLNQWSKGAAVEIVNIYGTNYLRTDKNTTARDNLENLPEF